MQWPAPRFEAFYEAYSKRSATNQILEHKAGMINAYYSNTNLDEDPKTRSNMIAELEEQCNQVINSIYGNTEEQVMEDNPFFEAHKRGMKAQGVPDVTDFFDYEDGEESFIPEPQEDYEVDQN